MSLIDSLRPNLDALLKEDLKAKKKEPLANAPANAPDRREQFAERVAHSHDITARTVSVRPSAIAQQMEEPEVLERRAAHRVFVVKDEKSARRLKGDE